MSFLTPLQQLVEAIRIFRKTMAQLRERQYQILVDFDVRTAKQKAAAIRGKISK